jgi:RNA polymerase sigma-70 factor (ECF subfamily)
MPPRLESTPPPGPASGPAPDLAALLARAASGDAAALGSFYDATRRRAYGLVLRIVGDRAAADETLLDVYEQVWRIAGSFDPQRGGAESWLLRIARTRALDALRARDRRTRRAAPLDAAVEAASPGADPGAEAAQREQSKRLAEVVQTLPPAQREAVHTAYYGGMSYAEAAAALSIPVGTFKTRIRTALAALRAVLYADGPTPETPR